MSTTVYAHPFTILRRNISNRWCEDTPRTDARAFTTFIRHLKGGTYKNIREKTSKTTQEDTTKPFFLLLCKLGYEWANGNSEEYALKFYLLKAVLQLAEVKVFDWLRAARKRTCDPQRNSKMFWVLGSARVFMDHFEELRTNISRHKRNEGEVDEDEEDRVRLRDYELMCGMRVS